MLVGQSASAIEAQIQEFGQTPTQLFTMPHPTRGVPGVEPDSPQGDTSYSSIRTPPPSAAVILTPSPLATPLVCATKPDSPTPPPATSAAEATSAKWSTAKRQLDVRVLSTAVIAMSMSHNGSHVAVVGGGGALSIYCMAKHQVIYNCKLGSQQLSAVTWALDCSCVVAGGLEGKLYEYSVNKTALIT